MVTVELKRLTELPYDNYLVFVGNDLDAVTEFVHQSTGRPPERVYILHNKFGRLFYFPAPIDAWGSFFYGNTEKRTSKSSAG